MQTRNLFLALTLALAVSQPVFAADQQGGAIPDMGGHNTSGHDMSQEMSGHDMGGHDMSQEMSGHDMGAVDQESKMGEKIHQSKVEGYQLAYHLGNNLERLAAAKKAGKAQDVDLSKVKSNHLMVYIKAADGGKVVDAKIGFLVKGPNGVEQTIMTMQMGSGFGADVEMKTPGVYTIKSKSTVGGKNLLDEFTYTKK
jgi:hypothetical protein